MQLQADSVFGELSRKHGEARAEELLKFWRDHRLDPPSSSSDVEDFFFQEVSS